MINNGGRAGLTAALFALLVGACDRRGEPRGFQGVVELEERDLAFEVSGRLKEIAVREGDVLAPGALVARLDDQMARTALAARESEARVADEQWKLLRAGARVEDVRALQARLQAAQAGEALASRNAERAPPAGARRTR